MAPHTRPPRVAPGAWSDDAHRASKDGPELGQFVDGILSDESADLGDSWVILHLEQERTPTVGGYEFRHTRFGIHRHASELVNREGLTVLTDTFLLEDDWSAVLQSDGECRDCHGW